MASGAASDSNIEFKRMETNQIANNNQHQCPPRGSGTQKLLAYLFPVLIVFLTLIAIVIGCVAISRTGRGRVGSGSSVPRSGPSLHIYGGKQNQSRLPSDGKIWTIVMGHDYGPYDYIDDEGKLKGFHDELIKAVCNAANMICKRVYDSYVNCLRSEPGSPPQGGKGLFGKWYDACTGWSITYSRTHIFSFSKPFLSSREATFVVKKGTAESFNDESVFNVDNPQPVGFLDGWSNEETCLLRYIKQKRKNFKTIKTADIKKYVVHYKLTTQLESAIANGSVIAGWAGKTDLNLGDKLEITKASFRCNIAGGAMMMRKDAMQFGYLWNRGFDIIRNNGVFKHLCTSSDHKPRGEITCVK